MSYKINTNVVIDDNSLFFPTNTVDKISSPTISAGTLTLDLNAGSVFNVSLNAAITNITVSNPQASGNTSSFVLIFNGNGTGYSVTWPAAFKFPGGTLPSLTSTGGKKDIFTIFTLDGGTSYNTIFSAQNV
jgi:hypothetical protein